MNGNLWDLLAARRHVGLRRLVAQGPDDAALARILAAAAQALELPLRSVYGRIVTAQKAFDKALQRARARAGRRP